MFNTAIFLSVIFTVIFKVNSLECYVCYDCDKVTDDYVASCESLDSTNSTTTNSTTTSTTSTTPTTTSTESSTTTPTSTSTESSTTTPTTTSTESSTTSTTTPTTTSTETTTTTTTTTTEGSNLMDIDVRANITFECVQGKITVNTTQVTVRDCIANRGNNSCESFGLASCSVCSTDKCNGAGSIQSSAAILLAVSFVTYLFKK